MDEIEKKLNSLLSEQYYDLGSWLDKDYLNEISMDIVQLKDYVPKDIELLLPNYELRSSFLDKNSYLITDEFQDKQILDQCAAGTTWEQHVSIYDEFFRKHPEFSKLIKDKKAYSIWKCSEPYYFND